MKYFWSIIGFIACLFGIFYVFNLISEKKYKKEVDKEMDDFIDYSPQEEVLPDDSSYVVTYRGRKYARLIR